MDTSQQVRVSQERLEDWMSRVERDTDGDAHLTIVIRRDGITLRVGRLHDGQSLAFDELLSWREAQTPNLPEAKIDKCVASIKREVEWLKQKPNL